MRSSGKLVRLGVLGAALSFFGCGDDPASGAPPSDGGLGGDAPGLPQPTIVSVAVEGSPEREVRQGSGAPPTNAVTTIVATGTNLAGARAVTVGTGDTAITGTIVDSSSGSSIKFRLSVPHGAPLGPQPINITTPRGVGTLAGAVTITEITASAASGNDATGKGTTSSPFKTYKAAAAVAQSGDTVLLKNGTYNAASGNDWATLTAVAFGAYDGAPNVPAGVTIKGESNTETKIVGPAPTTTGTAFIFTGDGALENLDIEQFAVGVLARGGTVSLKNIVVQQIGGDGVYVRGGSNATIASSTIKTAGSAGLSIFDTSAVTVDQGRITANGKWGVYSNTSGAITMMGTEIDGNWTIGGDAFNDLGGMLLTGLGAKTVGPLTLKNVNVHDNLRNGIDVRQTNGATTITISDSQFTKNKVYAIGVGTPALGGSFSLKLRNTTVTLDNNGTDCIAGSGIYVGDRARVDLGTSGESGGNTFNLSGAGGTGGGCRALNIASGTPTSTTTMKGTSFAGTTPTVPPAGCSNTSDGRKWEIASPGSCTGTPTGNVVLVF
jgi:hypothetical protein